VKKETRERVEFVLDALAFAVMLAALFAAVGFGLHLGWGLGG